MNLSRNLFYSKFLFACKTSNLIGIIIWCNSLGIFFMVIQRHLLLRWVSFVMSVLSLWDPIRIQSYFSIRFRSYFFTRDVFSTHAVKFTPFELLSIQWFLKNDSLLFVKYTFSRIKNSLKTIILNSSWNSCKAKMNESQYQ